MELTWFGEGCVRFRGREGTVAADAYRAIVGPTGRGLTADIATYSHLAEDDAGPARAEGPWTPGEPREVIAPSSLASAFVLESPGEFEVHDVLVTGARTYRDDAHGAQRGHNVVFVYELDGLHAAHLGDLGHALDEDMVGEIGTVQLVCVPIGSALSAARAAEVVAQLDANLVVPMLMRDGPGGREELDKFLHEMGAQPPEPQPKLSVTISTVPHETTLVLLESRGKV